MGTGDRGTGGTEVGGTLAGYLPVVYPARCTLPGYTSCHAHGGTLTAACGTWSCHTGPSRHGRARHDQYLLAFGSSVLIIYWTSSRLTSTRSSK